MLDPDEPRFFCKKGTVEQLRRLFCLGRRRRENNLRRWVLKDLRRHIDNMKA